MPEAAVHEHVRRDRPPRSTEVVHLEPERLLHVFGTHDRQLQEVDRDVDRNQPLHCRRYPGSFGVVGDLVGHAGPATAAAIYDATRNHNYTVRRNRLFLYEWAERLGATGLRPTRRSRCPRVRAIGKWICRSADLS